MRIFSSFYRITASLLILSFSMSSSVLSIESITKDSLEKILTEEIFNTTETTIKQNNNTNTEISHNLLDTKKQDTHTQDEENSDIKKIALQKLNKFQEKQKQDISTQEVERILETVIQKSEEEKLEVISTEKTCIIPADIPERIQKDFEKATQNIPCHLLQSLRKVEIFEDPQHIFPRAMANGRILKIRSDTIDEPEFIKVLIHELAHVVDLGGLTSENFSQKSSYKDGKKIIYKDDKSVLFYQLSWKTEYEKHQYISDLDFVGGYAAADMFEDYAESFLMYIEHGNEFRLMASRNEILQKKYNFFKTHIFSGKEFFTGTSLTTVNTLSKKNKRPWDITKL